MIAQTLRGPHNLYRRYQAFLESMATALGLAAIVVLALLNLKIYPENWIVVLGVAMVVLGVRWPLAAYILAVTALAYPIFTINFYLAVLFVAISALCQRQVVHYLGASVLIFGVLILAQYHLHWLVPILAGLWWGGTRGAWVGALAALWGKILAGMAGLDIDWLSLAGHSLNAQGIVSRFQGANSLQTLLLLVEPFAAASGIVLYNLLQIIGWAVAAGLIGSLAGRKWVKYRAPWSVLIVTAAGGLIMLATHLGLPYWLPDAMSETTLAVLRDPTGPLFSLVVVILVGTTIYSLREALDLPVAPPQKVWTRQPDEAGPLSLFRRSHRATSEAEHLERPRQPLRVPHASELPEWQPPKEDKGLIQLEID